MSVKVFYLEDKFCDEMLRKFVAFENENGNDPWRIIIDTMGGSIIIGSYLIYAISKHHEQHEVELVLMVAYSAGFYLFAESKAKKILAQSCRAMWHIGAVNIRVNHHGKPEDPYEAHVMHSLQDDKIFGTELARRYLNEEQFEQYMLGEDVYLIYSDLIKLFPSAMTLDKCFYRSEERKEEISPMSPSEIKKHLQS